MSSHLLPKAKEKILSGLIDLSPTSAQTFALVLVDSAHTPSDSQEFLSDISLGNRLAKTPALTSLTVTGGTVDCADNAWASVAAGKTGSYVYLILDTGAAGTSALISIVDTGTGVPISTNGGAVAATINASGLFSI